MNVVTFGGGTNSTAIPAMKKRIIKYLLLTISGVVLFVLVKHAATISRGYAAIGGEGAFILLPVLWWLIERTAKDTKNITEVMKNV